MEPSASESPRERAVGIAWRVGLGLYAALMFLLIAFYMGLAGRVVSVSSTVAGQPEVTPGVSAALRVGTLDVARSRFTPNARVEVALVQGAREAPLFAGSSGPLGLADINATIPPDFAPGEASWRVRITPPKRDEAETLVPVRLAPLGSDGLREAWASAATYVDEPDPGQRREEPDAGTGPVVLGLVAEGHRASDGLPGLFYVWAYERATGAPVRGVVTVTLVKGVLDGLEPGEVKTDEAGLGWFRTIPVGGQRWKLTHKRPSAVAGGAEEVSERVVVTRSVRSQSALELQSPLWREGEPLRANVLSLFKDRALYADVYQEGRWVYGRAIGVGADGGGLEIPAQVAARPARGVSLAWLQVYADPLQPGGAAEARPVLVVGAEVDERAALRVVLEEAAGAGVDEPLARALLGSSWIEREEPARLGKHLRSWMSRLPREVGQPVLLEDTQVGEKARLSSEKQEARGVISTLLAVLGGLGLAVLVYVLGSNLLAVRRQSRLALLEMAAESGEAVDPGLLSGGFARGEAWARMGVLVLTIGMFLVGILFLFRYL